MVLMDQIWDDSVAGPPPETRGLKHLRKVYTMPSNKGESSRIEVRSPSSMPTSPMATTPTQSPTAGQKDNVWRSVFNPGSNLATKNVGANYFDKPHPNTPTVYDWLYSEETRSKHQ